MRQFYSSLSTQASHIYYKSNLVYVSAWRVFVEVGSFLTQPRKNRIHKVLTWYITGGLVAIVLTVFEHLTH